jgi:hypothetical protein
MEKVRQEYVEGDKVSYDELMRGALKGILSTVDLDDACEHEREWLRRRC